MGVEIILLLVLAIGVLGYMVYEQEEKITAAHSNTQECLKLMSQIVDCLSKDELVINNHADLFMLLFNKLAEKDLLSKDDVEEIANSLGEVKDE